MFTSHLSTKLCWNICSLHVKQGRSPTTVQLMGIWVLFSRYVYHYLQAGTWMPSWSECWATLACSRARRFFPYLNPPPFWNPLSNQQIFDNKYRLKHKKKKKKVSLLFKTGGPGVHFPQLDVVTKWQHISWCNQNVWRSYFLQIGRGRLVCTELN